MPDQPSEGKRGRLADIAYDHIRERLVEGRYRPGETLAIRPLAEALEMSRQPVMEALKRLAAEGFVEIKPQIGCRVVESDRRDIADFFRLFAMAEALCAASAAERRTDADLLELQIALGAIGALGDASLPAELVAARYRLLNRDFHRTIHAMAHSATISEIARGLWDRADFYIGTTLGTDVFALRLEDALKEHQAIRDAISDADAPAARRLMEEHILAFGNAAAG